MRKIITTVVATLITLAVNATASQQLDIKVEKYLDSKVVITKSTKQRLDDKITEIEAICDKQKMSIVEKRNAISTIKNFNNRLQYKGSEYKNYILYTNDKMLLWDFSLDEVLDNLTKIPQIVWFLNADFLNIENEKQAKAEIPYFQYMYRENKSVFFVLDIVISTSNESLKFEINTEKEEIIVSLQ